MSRKERRIKIKSRRQRARTQSKIARRAKQQPEYDERRRRVTKGVLMVTTATAIAGVGGLAWVVSRESEEGTGVGKLGKNLPEVVTHYPQIQHLEVNSEFVVDSYGNKVKVINFSDITFDRSAVQDTFDSVNEFALRNPSFNHRYQLGEKQVSWATQPWNKNTIVLVVPNSAPLKTKETNPFGFTDTNPPENISFIRATGTTPFKVYKDRSEDYADYINRVFATEACQSTLVTGTEGATTEKDHYYMQEILCNSLGMSMALRQAGLSYEEYLNAMIPTTIGRIGSGENHSVITLDARQYEMLPTTHPIIP